MKFSTAVFLISPFTAGAIAVPANYSRPMGMNMTMIMESIQRCCDEQDTICHWSFTINVSDSRTECTFDVYGSNKAGARYSPNPGTNCGEYVIASSWSGQFGEGEGFVTLSVAHYPGNTIAWPAYRDDQLEGGGIVMPDRSYPIQRIE